MPHIRKVSDSRAISTEPASESIAINISSTDHTFPQPTRFIYVGGNGNLVCRLSNDAADITFTGLVAGTIYPMCVSIVRRTSTTITNSVALF